MSGKHRMKWRQRHPTLNSALFGAPPPSLRAAAGVGILRASIFTAVLGSTVAVASTMPVRSAVVEPPRPPENAQSAYADQVGELVETNECWTSDTPRDEVPSHVVFSRVDAVQPSPELGGRERTHQALEQVFNDKDYGIVVHAFCP